MTHDVAILGGGPTGLAAALILGRARKQVLLVDGGTPRNAAAAHVQGFPTQDGTPPAEFRAISHRELANYPKVQRQSGLVDRLTPLPDGGWRLSGAFGPDAEAKQVLLALGMVDHLPDWPGLKEAWGTEAFTCPFCHGWEAQDLPWVSVLTDPQFAAFAPFLQGWTQQLSVVLDGFDALPAAEAESLAKAGIQVHPGPIAELLKVDGHLKALRLADGTELPCEALQLRPKQSQSPLVQALELPLDPMGFVVVDELGRVPSHPGLWAAGDLTTMQQGALLGSAAGAKVAYALAHLLNLGVVMHPPKPQAK